MPVPRSLEVLNPTYAETGKLKRESLKHFTNHEITDFVAHSSYHVSETIIYGHENNSIGLTSANV